MSELIKISRIPLYHQGKVRKYNCPYCGRNKLVRKHSEEYGDYLECFRCGRAYGE